MKISVLLVASLFCFAVSASAQDAGVSTSTVDGARFELINPAFDRAVTFRLDKFTGTIHRLGTCPKDDSIGSDKCWKEMIVVDPPRAAAAGRIRFQIVSSGSSPKSTFLLQIDTGKTWQFGVDPLDKWHPFIECNDRTSFQCLWKQ